MRCHRFSFIRLVSLAAWLAAAASGLQAQSPPAEEKLLEVLASKAQAAEKCNACRELRSVGTEKSVPALAALLCDEETSHAARIALEAMPYPAAGAALRDAAGKASGLVKSGILDSLGERRDAEAVPVLASALDDKDLNVVAAAATAMGKIGAVEAAKALTAARAKAQGDAKTKIGGGLLLCADRLFTAGNRDEAAKLYRELSQPGETRPLRAAALRGVVRTGPQGAPALAESLASDDALLRAAAAGQLSSLSAADLRAVADGMAKLPAASQAAILMAIRVRGDKSFAPVTLEAAKGKDATVRIAAVRALGTVGDAAALPVLVELAAASDPVGDAARQSLEAICGPQIDEGIVALMQAEEDASRRAGWIGLLESRRPGGAVPVLLKEATHSSAEVRARAMAALAKLAAAGDVPLMLAAALKAEKGPERDSAEKAVMLVCQQIPDAAKRADPVIAALRNAGAADRAELLPLLGRIGGPAAKQAVQEALDGQAPQLYEAGVRAICNWPDPSVAAQLLKLSQTAKADNHRLWALRAFIRVVALPGTTPDADKLAMLKQAMQLAGRDEERGLVLERAAAVRTVESLRFLLPYLDQPALAQHACKSVVELARHKELNGPNKSEFAPALQQVIKVCKDAATVEKARRHLQSL